MVVWSLKYAFEYGLELEIASFRQEIDFSKCIFFEKMHQVRRKCTISTEKEALKILRFINCFRKDSKMIKF